MTFLNTDKLTPEKYKLNLEILLKSNQATFGTRSQRSYCSKIWNTLPNHIIKTSENLNSFKTIIKCYHGKHCTCRVCEYTTSRQ